MDYIPKKDSEKVIWNNNLHSRLEAEGAEMGLSADDITEYCKKVVASGELNRTANGVKPLAGVKPAPKLPVSPPKPTLTLNEAKTTAKGLFEKQDFSKVLAILIKDYKLTKYPKLEDFIAGESIEVIREIYTKVAKK